MALHDSDISALLRQFPPIDFGFAYGSGVVEQHGYEYSKAAELPMVDLVLVVKNSEEWCVMPTQSLTYSLTHSLTYSLTYCGFQAS